MSLPTAYFHHPCGRELAGALFGARSGSRCGGNSCRDEEESFRGTCVWRRRLHPTSHLFLGGGLPSRAVIRGVGRDPNVRWGGQFTPPPPSQSPLRTPVRGPVSWPIRPRLLLGCSGAWTGKSGDLRRSPSNYNLGLLAFSFLYSC